MDNSGRAFGGNPAGVAAGLRVQGAAAQMERRSAGILRAATLGLIVPAAEQAGGAWWLVLAGVVLGMLFLNVLDKLTPHLHKITGLDQEEHLHNASLNRILLFVLAIALHKFPEGIASGVGFNSEDVSNAWTVAAGIALQNIPEGMVVIAPLLLAGVSKTRTLLISLADRLRSRSHKHEDASADAVVRRRRDALCRQRRDDSRDPRPRLREDRHLVPRPRLRGAGAAGKSAGMSVCEAQRQTARRGVQAAGYSRFSFPGCSRTSVRYLRAS